MKNLVSFLLLLFLTTLTGCGCMNTGEDEPQTIKMRVNHYRSTGMGIVPRLTYLVQEGSDIGSDNWYKFYDPIYGFNYDAGYIYTLSVVRVHVDNPPADGSSYRYMLHKIISREEVARDVLFKIPLKINGNSFLTLNPRSELTILNKIRVDCHDLCDELEEKMHTQDFVKGTFKRLLNDKIQLVGLE